MTPVTLNDPDTPFAVVDQARLLRNSDRLNRRLTARGASLRPHVKTTKSLDAASLVFRGNRGPITVSTLAEADAFADAGYTDIVYAVGIAPHKLTRVVSLLRRGVDLAVLLDNHQQVAAVTQASADAGLRIPVLIEVDCDGHRGGIPAAGSRIVEIGTAIEVAAELRGVLVHAGESYFADTPEALAQDAENERTVAVRAATALRNAGLPCPVVSIGSTPTAHAAKNLDGITEVRAGNFLFFDLFMSGLGVCALDDLALSVVVTVIGHQPDKGWVITDGGWMAMSRDRGTARQRIDQGYGVVTDLNGRAYRDLIMSDASQEHGILTIRAGSVEVTPDLPVGARVRILPNHACATAAQHSAYRVINAGEPHSDVGRPVPIIDAIWPRLTGW